MPSSNKKKYTPGIGGVADGCAEEIIHDYIHGAKRQQAIGMMENLSIGAQDILGLLEWRDNLQEKIRNLRICKRCH